MPALSDIMTKAPFTTHADAVVAEIARAMVKGRFGSALVTQGSVLVGIFTERDVLRAAASGRDLTGSRVSEWMTRDPETAAPDTDAEDAAEAMMTGGFRHLPVLEGHEIVGVVSLRDVLSTRVRRTRG